MLRKKESQIGFLFFQIGNSPNDKFNLLLRLSAGLTQM